MSRPESIATRLPILKDGERLDRAAFHERYEAMPPNFRAELIEGVVVVSSPVASDHSEFHSFMMGLVWNYLVATPGTSSRDNATVILDADEVQPDVCLFVASEYGGRVRIVGKYLTGPPEFVVEVASSSRAHDLRTKLRVYERAGVEEYVVVLIDDAEIRWHKRVEGSFKAVSIEPDGLFRSTVFPGLWLDPEALFRLDAPAVARELRRGLASPEHEAFVRNLAARRGDAP